MIKFLVVGDIHEGVGQPLARIDDYEVCKDAVSEEIRGLATTHGCRAVLQLGDFLDAPRFGYDALSQIIQRWKPSFNSSIVSKYQSGQVTKEELLASIESDIPWIGIVGNHELSGNSLSNYDKTSLHFLTKIGFMTCVDRENKVVFTDDDGSTVAITGSPYHLRMDKDPDARDYIVTKKEGDVHLHLVHGYGTDRNFGKLFAHTTTDQFLPKTVADLTIYGHDHIGHDPVETDGKLAFNPGAPFLRKSDEVDRIPKVMLVAIDKGEIQLTPIRLSSHPAGSLVLTDKHTKNKKEKEQHLQRIKESVEEVQLKQGLSMTDIIENISTNRHLESEIKEDIQSRIDRKMTTLQVAQRTSDAYTLAMIELINFQSHGYTCIPCHEGLNVFVGESRNGKTAIQRALSFVYEGSRKVNARRYIKKGTTRAEVVLTLSNGYKITRWVTDAKANNNGYKIFNPHTNEIEEGNTQLIEHVQSLLGFYPLMIDEGRGLPINFKKQQDGWTFIGDQLSAPDRAKVIGAFYGTHYADAVGKDYDTEHRANQRDLKKSLEEEHHLTKEVESYAYLELLSERLALAEQKEKEIESQMAEYERLKELLKKMLKLKAQLEHLESLKKKLDAIEVDVKPLQAQATEYRHVRQLWVKRERILKQGGHYRKLSRQIKQIGDYHSPLRTIQLEAQAYQFEKSKYQQALKKIGTQKGLQQKIETLTRLSQGIPNTAELLTQHAGFVQDLAEGKRLQSLYVKGRDLGLKIDEEKAELVKVNETLTERLGEYRDELSSLGQCPICQSSIEEHVVDRIMAKHLNQETSLDENK